MEEVEQGQGPQHEQELNAKVLYDVSGGLSTHGRFAIGYGAVRAAEVRAAAKENNVSQSNFNESVGPTKCRTTTRKCKAT